MEIKPTYFDIHTHVSDVSFDVDRTAVFERMTEKKVWAITVGVDRYTSQKAAQIGEFVDTIYSCIGQHPTDKPSEKFDIDFYKKVANESKNVVSVGECGLDYSYIDINDQNEKKRQIALFEDQVELAIFLDVPLMIHCRDAKGATQREAHETVLSILEAKKKEHGDIVRANIHFYSEGVDITKRYLDLGCTLSFGGVLTFTRDYDESLQYAPITRIMSETDAPFVAPVPYRGKRNEPSFVVEVVNKIAEVRGESLNVLAPQLVDNALNFFNIQAHTK